MAEGVIGSILEVIVAHLVPQALENAGKLWGVRHELMLLRDTLSTLRVVLEHAEEQYCNSEIQDWLEKLKDALYEAQDVLEEFIIEAMRRQLSGYKESVMEVKTFFSSSNRLAFQMKMKYKLRALGARIETINANGRSLLDERNVNLQVEREWRNREETHSFIRDGDIIGRDDDKKKVMEFLLNSDVKENVSILPIVGAGGLGKTTLAQCVYCDGMVTKHFDLKMWISVSNDFNVKKIVEKIIACATIEEPDEVTMELLQCKLRREIDGKRYFLVLDHLCITIYETWLRLKTLLLGGARGSKILITTRLDLVAKITHTESPYILDGLSDSASLDLLMRVAAQNNENMQDSEKLAIGKEIVRECSGNPLVIRTVGSILCKKTTSEWLYLKDYNLPEVFQWESIKAIKDDEGPPLDEHNLDLRLERELRKREETHSFIRDGDIIGRDDDKKKVMKFLLNSDVKKNVSILPIVGAGGLGKTALAQCVYCDGMVGKHFDLKMWISVSNDFNVKKIVEKIIAHAKMKVPSEVGMELLQSKLRAEIDGKRYFLVLDDLRITKYETWLGLNNLLLGGARGSKILITTRLDLVAKITHTESPYILDGLSDSASLDLLMRMAAQNNENMQDSEKLAIGKEIVRECSWNPLVIRTVGSILCKKTTSEWLYLKDYNLPEVLQWESIKAIKDDEGPPLDEHNLDLQAEGEWRKREETHSFIRDGVIIGRDDDKKTIKKFLLNSDVKEHVSILPIVGIGGIGKTALAQCVYNDEMVSTHFHLKMWVCVSNGIDEKKIVKESIICAKKEEPYGIVMEQLLHELRVEIDGKRYLLVLDDLWDVDIKSWTILLNFFESGARGSKILITTRRHQVARMVSDQLHFLKSLSEKSSLDLLMQMAGRKIEEIQDSDMLAIGIEIVEKCSRVPLVVRTVGSLLFFKKTKSEWLRFKDHELPQVYQTEESIKSVLQLSYDHLPSHLKQCFAFCALFPKDYEIKKQTLINLWMAEGFIQQLQGRSHLENIADQYFSDLLQGNFFQDFQKDSFTNKETCKMPTLMHDLACSVTGTECWVAGNDTKCISERTRHMSHGSTSNLMGVLPNSHLKAGSLRTFLSVPTHHEMEQRQPTSEADLRQLIQSFKRLRILDLHAAIVKKVPRSICRLKYLTYLDLSHNNALKRLPNSITRLQNLQTLNLQGCSALEELPRDIRKLVNLRNLDIDYCYSLSYMPRGLGLLNSLHRLTRFILPKGKALAKNYCGLRELNRLKNIRGSLSIENLGHSIDALVESRAANLIGKHSLESLILKWGYLDTDDAVIDDIDENILGALEPHDTDDAVIDNIDKYILGALEPHSRLEKLMIDGYEGKSFPKWTIVGDSLQNLVEVRFLRCGRCEYLPQLGRLPHLKSLEIWRLTELKYIELDNTSTTSFPSLLRLEIRHCKNLKGMPPTQRLENLILIEVNRELIYKIFDLNKLKSLDISLMDLDHLPEKCLQSLTSLERLSISECPQLTSFSHGMRHLSNIRHLSFSNCEELDLSKDESDNTLDLQGLKRLQIVDILGVPKLASLPHWLLHVSNLQRLSIKKCLNLKVLSEQIEALQSLQQLEIVRCPLLTSLPKGIRKLASLSHLRIAGCPNLEERCKEDAGEDLAHITHKSYNLEYYERHL